MKRGSMIPLPQEGRPAYLSKNPDCIELDWTAPCHRGAEIYSYDFLVSEDPKFCQDATRHLEVAGESSILKVDGRCT
ncbi:unnamed protein product [Polarella glacialis]|uniref:Uncharacterized protein n=1 Tax=Polarella glacialis TaxID=89957 RepID=A0A813JZ61_POLGL|nr:unnamed protein product [Polarella glacialis]